MRSIVDASFSSYNSVFKIVSNILNLCYDRALPELLLDLDTKKVLGSAGIEKCTLDHRHSEPSYVVLMDGKFLWRCEIRTYYSRTQAPYRRHVKFVGYLATRGDNCDAVEAA